MSQPNPPPHDSVSSAERKSAVVGVEEGHHHGRASVWGNVTWSGALQDPACGGVRESPLGLFMVLTAEAP
jgi:hypothetical protein